MRTFVAVELDEPCRRGLREAVEALRGLAGGVRWVKPDALHLTLKFIGELGELDLPRAVECLGPATSGRGPFSMRVAGLSGFPPRGTPRIVHVGVEEPTGTLSALQAAVDKALADGLGVAPEGRRYVPHVTLGRVKNPRACVPVEEMSGALERQEFGRVDVSSFVLMKSDLRPTGAVYSVVHRFPLG